MSLRICSSPSFVLVSEDNDWACQLIAEKDELGILERHSMGQHFSRLREGNATSIQSSDIRLETPHALRRINSLMAGMAYSILSDSGGPRLVQAS